jgi:hypothetical protein
MGSIKQASVRDNFFGRHNPALLVFDLDCGDKIPVFHGTLLLIVSV